MNGEFRVSLAYLDWAHGPAAEDGHDKAIRLMNIIPKGPFGKEYCLVSDPVLVAEIADVAELYVGSGETDLRAARVLSRAKDWLKARSLQKQDLLK